MREGVHGAGGGSRETIPEGGSTIRKNDGSFWPCDGSDLEGPSGAQVSQRCSDAGGQGGEHSATERVLPAGTAGLRLLLSGNWHIPVFLLVVLGRVWTWHRAWQARGAAGPFLACALSAPVDC